MVLFTDLEVHDDEAIAVLQAAGLQPPLGPPHVFLPSSFILGPLGKGVGMVSDKLGKGNTMALGGAAAGTVMYGMCKSKCPGAKGGLISNMPMVGSIAKFAKGGLGAMGIGGETNDDDEEKEMEDKAEQALNEAGEEEGKDTAIYAELEAAEYSACRLNCKIKSLMAAAAAAGAVGLLAGDKGGSMMPMGSMAAPLDEWTVGPWLGTANAYDLDFFSRRKAIKAARHHRLFRQYWSQDDSNEESCRLRCPEELLVSMAA